VADPTTLNAVTAPLRQLGIALPDEATRLLDVLKAAQVPDPTDALLADLTTLDPDNVAERLRQAALDHAARQAAPALLQRLTHRIGTGIAAALRTDGDRIVTELRDRLEQALPAVTEAAHHFAPTDKPATILDRGQDAADAYLKLRDALPTLEAVHAARFHLARTCAYGRADVPAAMFVTPPADLAGLRNAGRAYADTHGTGGRWLALVRDGHTVTLNTAAETDALVNRLEKQAATARAETQRTTPRPATFSYAPAR
jgi:hypothetical protein